MQCRKPVPRHLNFCNTDCHIQHYRDHGAKEYLPNGLPIGCMTSDLLLECEHGDHPDYKFPITVEYCGREPAETYFSFVRQGEDGKLVSEPCPPHMLYGMSHETHAVIYTDGYVLVTMNECCYAMWSARDGECWGGNLWKRGEWKVSAESLEKLRPLAEELEDRSKR